MSVEDAKKFIAETTQTNNGITNMIQNTFSKFESKPTKLEYIATKAKELGFNFNPTELQTALSEMKSSLTPQELEKIAGGSSDDKNSTNPIENLADKAKSFWNSLW